MLRPTLTNNLDGGSRLRRGTATSSSTRSGTTSETFRAFIDVLAAGTADLLTRMKLGHEPDEHGWCRHTTHEYRWESHPCSVLRLAQLAEINSGPPI